MANIEVYDDSGRVQIIDRPSDMILIEFNICRPEDVVIDTYQSHYSMVQSRYYNPPAGINVLMALQPSKEAKYANRRLYNQGITNTRSIDGSYFYYCDGNPMSIYYFTWIRPPNMPKENFGIEVFNDDGDVVWASYEKSMNILAHINVPDMRDLVGTDLFRYNFGHQDVAVIPVKVPFYISGRNEYTTRFYFDTDGALAIFRHLDYTLDQDEADQAKTYYNYYRAEYLVVDVRNVQQSDNQKLLPRFSIN